ncbi:hypothetical protein D9M71_769430 [compost metagenome]|jgi:hypothetical protein
MKHIGIQTGIGLWLAIAIFFGLAQRSWNTFFYCAAVALLFAFAKLTAVALKDNRQSVRRLGVSACVFGVVAVVLGLVWRRYQ